MGAGDEMVEVVDEDDRVVDVVTRRRVRAENLRHRAVFVVVVASDGRVLIHRRSDEKDLWPGRWDLAAGGVVGVGEPYDEAARRELAEELGIDAEPALLGPYTYEDGAVRSVGRVYRAVHDGEVSFRDGEVVEACWVTRDELRSRLERDSWVGDSPAVVLPHLGD